MNNKELLQVLAEVATTKLSLLEIANDCKGADGSLDITAMAANAAQLEEAAEEARHYANGTRTLLDILTCFTSQQN